MKRTDFEMQCKEYFTELFGKQWRDKMIWEHIRDGALAATPAFEGEEYCNAGRKIMFVGRALNGWNEEYACCDSLEDTVSSVLSQNGAFDTFINEDGYPGNKRRYYHKNSNFFRFIKHVLEESGESEHGIDENWHNDPKRWNQKFVWANLFCIAPKNPAPGESGNPHRTMMRQSIDTYIDLMELYIRYYSPDAVIFITGRDGWFDKLWVKERSFADMLDTYNKCDMGGTVMATGTVGKSKIIVCNRPDRRGTSYDTVKEMAKITASLI